MPIIRNEFKLVLRNNEIVRPVVPGQRWKFRGYEVEVIDLIENPWLDQTQGFELTLRRFGVPDETIQATDFTGAVFIGGPKYEEPKDAFERIARLGCEVPPNGMHPDVWRGVVAHLVEHVKLKSGLETSWLRNMIKHSRDLMNEVHRLEKAIR